MVNKDANKPQRRLARAHDDIVDFEQPILSFDRHVQTRIVNLLVLNAAVVRDVKWSQIEWADLYVSTPRLAMLARWIQPVVLPRPSPTWHR